MGTVASAATANVSVTMKIRILKYIALTISNTDLTIQTFTDLLKIDDSGRLVVIDNIQNQLLGDQSFLSRSVSDDVSGQ